MAHAIAERDVANNEIWITAATEGDCVRVSVSDTGAGIPAELIEHVFEPFVTTKGVGGRHGARIIRLPPHR